MKKLSITVVVTSALALTAWQVARARESAPTFQIVVHTTAKGIDLKCVQGCAWLTASYSCGAPRPENPAPVTDCFFGVDERGVGPAPKER